VYSILTEISPYNLYATHNYKKCRALLVTGKLATKIFLPFIFFSLKYRDYGTTSSKFLFLESTKICLKHMKNNNISHAIFAITKKFHKRQ
jgi:hypothetical protein